MSKRSLLIVCPYPKGEAPSQRFRFEQYVEYLKTQGWEIRQESFWSKKAWKVLYQPGHVGQKFAFMAKALLRRKRLLFGCKESVVFIHREFSPVGLPLTVWVLKHLWRKKIVFDFDDALWIPNSSLSNRWIGFLKSSGNTRRIIAMADGVFCGNRFLQAYALKHQKNTFLIPTTIDTKAHHNREANPPKISEQLCLGWTGSHSTMHYLKMLWPVLDTIHKEHPLRFVVISDQPPDQEKPYLEYIPWSRATEIEGLLSCHVGLMPLLPDPWSEGKCGFKALQYLALGIPAFVSPVGVNSEIVKEGFNGFLCDNENAWLRSLRWCIEHPQELSEMKNRCRPDLEKRFSVQAFEPVYHRILCETADS